MNDTTAGGTQHPVLPTTFPAQRDAVTRTNPGVIKNLNHLKMRKLKETGDARGGDGAKGKIIRGKRRGKKAIRAGERGGRCCAGISSRAAQGSSDSEL